MKRLLAYLFIVLGLGLTFSVSANAAVIKHKFCGPGELVSTSDVHYKLKSYIKDNHGRCFPGKEVSAEEYILFKLLKNTKKLQSNNPTKYKSQQEAFNSELKIMLKDFENKKISSKKIINTIEDNWKLDKFYTKYKTQIAKSEPSETQEVAKENLNEIMSIAKKTSRWRNESAEAELRSHKYHCITKDFKKLRRIGGCGFDIDARTFLDIRMVSGVIYDKYGKDPKLFFKKLLPLREEITQNYLDKTQTQIAKAEPSQTQKVDSNNKSDIQYCLNLEAKSNPYFIVKDNRIKCSVTLTPQEYVNDVLNWYAKQNANQSSDRVFFSLIKAIQEDFKGSDINKGFLNQKIYDNYKKDIVSPKLLAYLKDELIRKNNFLSINYDQWLNNKTQIAKAEPSQTPKVVKKSKKFKKIILSDNIIQAAKNKGINTYKGATNVDYCFRIKSEIIFISSSYVGTCVNNGAVNLTYDGQNYYYYGMSKDIQIAKVEDSTQEEFKPKKTNQDKDPPIIEVAEKITVSDSAYEIKGNVKDKSKKIFIEVDGQTIPVKKGKFKLKRFSPVDEQIKIVAIDQWGNRSKPKIVNVTIDIKNIEVAEKIEPLNPTKMRSKKNKDKIALIIGIEKYDQIPSASYANLDAKFFYEYVRKGFGVSKSNIKLLIDEDADLVKSLGTLNKWLPGKIRSGQTELVIFFAGHGLASNNGKELYILPQDSDPDLLERTALSRNELFKQIIDLNPKSVTMFFDTCFSGISRDEKTLLASARPIRIVGNEEEGIPDNFTIFSASQLDQISSGLKEAKHGIFSYYLMKGLEGYADANKDKNITNGELLAYMDENVSQKASELGRQQNPSLAGDPEKVLISYR